MKVAVRDAANNARSALKTQRQPLARATSKNSSKPYIMEGRKQKKLAISSTLQVSPISAIDCGAELVKKDVCEQTKVDGQLAYVMIPFIQANKSKIVRIANDPKKVDALPSARRVRILQNAKTVVVPTRGASVHRLHIDDLLSFQKVRKIRFNGAAMPEHVSEKQFKDGVTRIIGEGGIFKDWGGEYADLYTTRLVYKKRRMAAAFAFKGPGEKRKLVPGRMGKNGDQVQRMFQLDAQIFFAQHWREIEASVATEMYTHAVMKSYSTGNPIYYGIIDGQDSERLRRAYPKIFGFVE